MKQNQKRKTEKHVRFDKFNYNQFKDFMIYTIHIFKPDVVNKIDNKSSYSYYVKKEQNRILNKTFKERLNWNVLNHILDNVQELPRLQRKKRFAAIWRDVCPNAIIVMQDENEDRLYRYRTKCIYYDFNTHTIKVYDPILNDDFAMHQFMPNVIRINLDYYRSCFYFATNFFAA